jgi:hypothetical protein
MIGLLLRPATAHRVMAGIRGYRTLQGISALTCAFGRKFAPVPEMSRE